MQIDDGIRLIDGEELGWFVANVDGEKLLEGNRVGLLVGFNDKNKLGASVGFVEGISLTVGFNDAEGLIDGE